MERQWNNQFGKYRSEVENLFTLYQARPDIQAYLEIILSLITVIVFGLFAIRPTANTITALIQENRGKEETLNILNIKIKNLTQASQVFEQNKDKILLVNNAVPETQDSNNTINVIQNALDKNLLTLNTQTLEKINVKGSKTTVAYDKNENAALVPFTLGITSNFTTLNNFVKSIENSSRQMVINSASITTETTEIDNPNPQPILTITAGALYYQNPNEPTN